MGAKANAGTPGAGGTNSSAADGGKEADAVKEVIVPESGVEGISAKIKAGMKKADAGQDAGDDEQQTPDAGQDAGDDGQQTPDAGQDAGDDDQAGKDDDADDDDANAEDPDLNDGKIKDGEIKGLAPEAQAKVNQRIHEFNVKRKNAQAEAETAKARVTELETKQGDLFKEVAKLGLAPDYVTKDEAAKIARYDVLKGWNRWLSAHLGENYEGSDPKTDPSMTAAEIRDAKAEVEEELMELAGEAKSIWKTKVQLMQADMARGRAARLAEAAAGGKKTDDGTAIAGGRQTTDDGSGKKKTDDGAGKKKIVMTPPKLPAGSGATRRPPISAGGKPPAAFDQGEFKEQGANRGALTKQFEKVFGGG